MVIQSYAMLPINWFSDFVIMCCRKKHLTGFRVSYSANKSVPSQLYVSCKHEKMWIKALVN